MTIEFMVVGIPRPGGSKRAIPLYSKGKLILTNGRPIINVVDAGKDNADWKSLVSYTAKKEYSGPPLEGPLNVTMDFTMPRPKGHLNSKGEVKPKAPKYPTTKPDVLKLVRSTEDALTGILWKDDAQTHRIIASKWYSNGFPGVKITVSEAP